MEKTRLQMLAHKRRIELPSYSCTREGPDHLPRFKATVTYDGEIFKSPNFCQKQRDAENAAAEVALKSLLSRDDSLLEFVKPEDTISRFEVDQVKDVEYKIRLLEASQKAKVPSPTYVTSSVGPSHLRTFTCIVEIVGMSFTGKSSTTKKQAEKNAASAAWLALKKIGKEDKKLHILEGTDENGEFSIIVNLLASKYNEEGMSLPKSPIVVSDMPKDFPTNKRIRPIMLDKDCIKEVVADKSGVI